jgi:arginyl-tRNA synthetase
MQGEDGKRIRTRAGESVKLKELLSEAVSRAKAIVEARDATMSSTNSQAAAEIIGLGAVKYADLMMNRESNYKFSFSKMLSLQGNTAPYMLYAYARVRSIQRKLQEQQDAINNDAVQAKLTNWNSCVHFKTKEEKNLLVHLIRMEDVVHDISQDLLPNRVRVTSVRVLFMNVRYYHASCVPQLCEYLYQLAQHFGSFYEVCPVLNAESEDLLASRYQLCVLTASKLIPHHVCSRAHVELYSTALHRQPPTWIESSWYQDARTPMTVVFSKNATASE